jgi:ABC-2 type transport system permease protein
MRKLSHYIKIYFMITSQFIKARMQYQADFWVGIIGVFMSNILNVLVLWLIFRSIPTLAGWNYYELLFFSGFFLLALTPQHFFFDHVWGLSHELQTGNFIKYYFRPLNMMFYFMSQQFDLKGFGQLGFGLVLIFYASSHLAVQWDLLKFVYFLITWFSASLIMIAIVVVGASAGFWIINTNSLMVLLCSIRDFSKYPLSIFNGIFRFAFTFVFPIGFIAFYPTQLLLKPAAEISPVAYFSPLVGILLFALAYALWAKGINSYSGTGT